MELDEESSTEVPLRSMSRKAEGAEPAVPRIGEKPRFAGLYREDVVQNVGQPNVMGMVTKVAGDSDSSSDSESEDDAEDVALGCARICWTNLEESTEKIEDIRVVDRAFMHGDIVAAVSSPLGQIGTVVNVDLRVDLEFPNGEIIKGIDSRKIKRVRPLVVGDYVIHDHWLGRVDEVFDNVTVMFDDGSKCKVVRADPERLCPSPLSPMDDSECPYYPGQRVRANSSALFKAARWLKGSWKANRMEGTVAEVEVASVMVYWIAAAHTGYNSQPATIPAEQQDPKHLKRMADLSYTSWQLGDRALLPQKLARRIPVSSCHPAEVSHSDCETETVENVGQAHASESSEAGATHSVAGSKDPVSDSWVAYRRKLKRRFSKHKKKALRKDDFVETALLIVGTKTRVDVLWQDGTRELGVDACTLFPVDHLGDHDFWPEQHVMEKGSDLDGSDSEPKRVGIVKSVDAKQRTAKVRWLLPVDQPEEGRCFDSEEVVSVYELIEHPDYSYSLGDVVIRLCTSVDTSTEALLANVPNLDESDPAIASIESKAEVQDGNNTPASELQDCENKKKQRASGKSISTDFSWVGMIIGLQDGKIEVAWADGKVSKVGPEAIFVVGRDEDDDSSQTSGIANIEEADDAGSWTTVDSLEMNEGVAGEQDFVQSDWDEGSKEAPDKVDQNNRAVSSFSEGQSTEGVSHGLGSALSLPFTALIRALRFAAGLLWTLRGSRRSLGSDQVHSGSENQTYHMVDSGSHQDEQDSGSERAYEENEGLKDTSSGQIPDEAVRNTHTSDCVPEADAKWAEASDGEIGISQAAENTRDSVERLSAIVEDDAKLLEEEANAERELRTVECLDVFKQFDSVKDFTDHQFTNEISQPSSQRRWAKKVQQEWVMLEKNLPGTIYVRVYEERMDLMRAVIVGASGTPYQDGLFFFDIYLPPEYPSVPPLVHYHSGGLRLNPNLYETGKVCLSLLNTWTGKGNEIWHPSTSSILQVLVSIQGLVLNANPYFNEAGYDRQMGTAEGEKNSLAYTENSFLLSCKSMLYIMRRPPKHFEDFVQDHFKRRGPYILQACTAYMQGHPVGSLSDDATISPSQSNDCEQTSSAGFRIMLAKILPRLVTALKEKGMNCEHHELLGA